MKLEFDFDEALFRRQVKFFFDLSWKKNLKKNQVKLLYSFLFLIFGILLFEKSKMNYVFIAFGIYYFVSFLEYYFRYKSNKKKYFNIVEEEIEKQHKNKQPIVWELHDEYFGYKDYKFDLKFIWVSFKDFRVIENMLILSIEKSNIASYVLSEVEVGSEKFNKVVTFLEGKVNRK